MKLFKKFLLAGAGLLIGLIVIEMLLRTYYWAGQKQLFGLKPSRTTITWQNNPIIGPVLLTAHVKGWFVTPSREYYSYIEANQDGFYDYDHTVVKPTDTYRIILLGDSFVASLQTTKNMTIAKQLENNLNSVGLPFKVEVIAMGMGDTGSAQQYLALQNIGLKYQPDLVIQMFLTANDLKNNWPSLEKDPYRPYFILDKNQQLTQLPFTLKSQRSKQGIKDIFKQLRTVEFALSVRQSYQERQTNSKADYPIEYHVYDTTYNPDYQSSWQVTKSLLEATKLMTEKSGAKYLLTVLANNEQVNKDVWAKLQQTYPNLKKANLDLTKPDQLLGQFCTTQQINCHFMLPDFLSYEQNHNYPKTHYTYDGHWNNLGTYLAADSLTKYLLLNQVILNH